MELPQAASPKDRVFDGRFPEAADWRKHGMEIYFV